MYCTSLDTWVALYRPQLQYPILRSTCRVLRSCTAGESLSLHCYTIEQDHMHVFCNVRARLCGVQHSYTHTLYLSYS